MKKDIFSESERLAFLSSKFREMFDLWGYREIFLPTVENLNERLRKGIKLVHNGEIYVVKPDLTSQILANYKDDDKTIRIFYISEVLNSDIKGMLQAGIEFIGGKEREMWVEVLSIVITSLDHVGLKEFYLDIGSLRVWKEATEDIGGFREEVFLALKRRNFGIIEELPIDDKKKEELWKLFNFRGKKSGFEDLDFLIEALKDERVFLDLGTMRLLNYYDDMVFEAYAPGFGFPIGGGGDYIVNGKKGVGFAFYLNNLVNLCEFNEVNEDDRIELSGDLIERYERARDLVRRGIAIKPM